MGFIAVVIGSVVSFLVVVEMVVSVVVVEDDVMSVMMVRIDDAGVHQMVYDRHGLVMVMHDHRLWNCNMGVVCFVGGVHNSGAMVHSCARLDCGLRLNILSLSVGNLDLWLLMSVPVIC